MKIAWRVWDSFTVCTAYPIMRARVAIPVPRDIFVITDVTSWGYAGFGDLLRVSVWNKIV